MNAEDEIARRMAQKDYNRAVAHRQECLAQLAQAQHRLWYADQWLASAKAGLPGTGVAEAPENAPSREDGAAPVSPDRPERPERATPPWRASHQRT